MFTLSLSRTPSSGLGSQLRRSRCPGSCARASWIDSGYGGDQADLKKGKAPDRSISDLQFARYGIQIVSDQKESRVPSLQWETQNQGTVRLS